MEVYGPGWEDNDSVKPFYKGITSHGKELADIYRAARYALVVHPFELNSQRLAEVSACGTIPIVYDCRHSSVQPHWENDLLFYSSIEGLKDILESGGGSPVPQIAEYYSYENFARRIIGDIEASL